MSVPLSTRRAERIRIDRAVGRVYSKASGDPEFLKTFDRLQRVVRGRSALLAPGRGGHGFDSVAAIATLARAEPAFLRRPEEWDPRGGHPLRLVHSLAEHLLAAYRVPVFLAHAWFEPDRVGRDRARTWFRVHGGGTALRRCVEEVDLTRRMERLLLSSPHHLDPLAAIRRVEVLALGGSSTLAAAIARSPMARTLENSDFWRTVIRFFVRFEASIPPGQVERWIESIDTLRHARIEVVGAERSTSRPPPLPRLSLVGRTPASLERLLEEWSDWLFELRRRPGAWPRLGPEGLRYLDASTDTTWHLIELLDSAALREEGQRMRHCVGKLAYRAHWGRSSFWSLRIANSGRFERSVLTVEVDPRSRTVVTVLGKCNRAAGGLPLEIVRRWAGARGLRWGLGRG